ncbi:MAG: hypothetical protein JNG84_08675 [Archangium sp.]|nr:hypothetical protein [Archangium sp.]
MAAALTLVATAAHADSPSAFSTATSSATLGAIDSERSDFSNFRVEVHLDFGWYSAFGGGLRLEVPLSHNGIIDGVNDEIALSFGAELFYFYPSGSLGIGVYPILAVQWNFFVGSRVSLFPELGVAFLFGPSRASYWGTFIAPYLGLGIRYHFNARNALLARVSWPAGLQLGITF